MGSIPSTGNDMARPLLSRILRPPFVALLVWASACSEGSDPSSPGAPATIALTPSVWVADFAGDTQTFTAEVLDARGRTVEGVQRIWTSSNGGVVSISAQGVAVAVGPGQAQVRVSAGAVSAEAVVTVRSGPAVSPAALPDGRARFPYASELQAVGGAPPYGWSLADGALPAGITLAADGRLSGTPTQEGTFTPRVRILDARGDTASRTIRLRVCPGALDIPAGGSVSIPIPGGDDCSPLIGSGTAGDRWRIAIYRTSLATTASDLMPVTLSTTLISLPSGALQETLGAQRLDGALPLPWIAEGAEILPDVPDPRGIDASRLLRSLEIEQRTAMVHSQMREMEARLFAELGPQARVLPDLSGTIPVTAPALAGTLPTGGGGTGTAEPAASSPLPAPSPPRRTFIPYSGQCANPGTPVPALLVAENDLLAVYQDSAQASRTPAPAARVRELLTYYQSYGDPVIRRYFGGVGDIDGNGRIVIFISPLVAADVAGFVWSGDFFARTGSSSCSASNQMELIYLSVDILQSMGGGDFQALSTVVHEAKHVSSLYRRVRYGVSRGVSSPYHASWVEEGTAEIAAEVSSRLAWEARGGPSLSSPVRRQDFTASGFSAENYGVALRMARVATTLSAQPNALTVDPTGAESGHTFYGSSWLFHRFLADAWAPQGALADSAFFRIQNDSTTAPSPGAFAGLSPGRPHDQLMGDYVRALILTGTGPTEPARSFTRYRFGGGASTSVTEIFRTPNPLGVFPWPVTTTGTPAIGSSAEVQNPAAPFATREFRGSIGPSGVRIHELVATQPGQGVELRFTAGSDARIVIARLP